MKELHNITIGTDPELFLFDNEHKCVKSAIGLIPGTKQEPYQIDKLGNGFALQTDNISIEFNVPAVKLEDKNTFIDNILKMKEYILNYVKNINPNFTLNHKASNLVPYEELNCDEAWEFGCDPDFNCYTRKQNPRPALIDERLRSVGMHIHIGYDKPNVKTSVTLIKYMDLFLGLPSILIDDDQQRRYLYGKAGCFRIQPWGVEYRTLSGYFLSNIDTLEFVYNQTVKAINAYCNEVQLPKGNLVQLAINDNNLQVAKDLIQKYNII